VGFFFPAGCFAAACFSAALLDRTSPLFAAAFSRNFGPLLSSHRSQASLAALLSQFPQVL
jgi:hypothetical protein